MSAIVGMTIRSLVRRNTNMKFINKLMVNQSLIEPKPTTNLNNIRHTRFYSSCGGDECAPEEESSCRKTKCQTSNVRVSVENIPAENYEEIESPPGGTNCMYDDPVCCQEQCPDANIRLDCLYYRPSDKSTRYYQQTWVECPPLRKVPKVVCCNDLVDRDPPLPRRERIATKPKTACSMGIEDSELMECTQGAQGGKCIKIKLANCREARDPPKCKRERYPRECKKIKCPYPSYSECNKPKPRKARRTECSCLEIKSLCEIYALARKKGMKIP